jgi:hypothetical protein
MQSSDPISITELRKVIDTYRFRYTTEQDLQNGIEEVLRNNGIDYRREESISKADRPDFLVGCIAVEVKTKGSLSALLRQIARYATHENVESILVVGTPRWIHAIPQTLGEKEIHSLRLIGSLL